MQAILRESVLNVRSTRLKQHGRIIVYFIITKILYCVHKVFYIKDKICVNDVVSNPSI